MLKINILKTKRMLVEIGTAMVLISMPLGMIVKLLVGNMIFGNIIMALGLMFMFSFKRLKEGFHPNLLSGIGIFFIISFVYYALSKFSDSIYLLYLGVTLIYTLELSLLKYENDLKIRNVIFYMWLLSLFCVLGGYFCFATGIVSVLTGAFGFSDTGDTIYDGLTMGSVGITQLACSLYFISTCKESKRIRTMMFICVIIDFFIVLLAFKRTPLLIALIILGLYMRKLGYLSLNPRSITIFIAIIVGITVIIISSADLREGFSIIAEETWTGITNLITSNHTGHGLTNSTDMRIENRHQAFALIGNFDLLSFFIGAGFMTFWFDMPLIQAYLDMGVIGFILYAFYIVYLPLHVLFTSKQNNNELFLLAMLALYGSVACLTSGHPYAHNQWMPICLLCFVLSSRNTLISSNNEVVLKV